MTDDAEVPSRSYPREETFAAFLVRGFRGTRGLKGVHPPLNRIGLPGWAWRALTWALAIATLALLILTPWAYALFFVVFPLLWLVHRRLWVAILAHIAFGVGLAVVLRVLGEEGWWVAALTTTLVNLVGGMWVTWIQIARFDAVVALADRERALAALARTQDELAAAERAAGIAAERERWAREVHDTLAQGFISVITLTQAARAELTRDRADEAASRLDQMEALARDNLAEARALVAGEGPSALRSGDLVQALNRLVDARRDPGLDIDLDARPPRDLARAVEVVVVRTVQEALSNIARHSRAGHAEVVVAVERLGAERELVIAVTDDGTGTGGRAEGTGLTGMRSRVESLGGTLTVDPARAPDADGRTGTVVEARIPL